MNSFSRSAGPYVILLVILFAIVTTASRFIIVHLGEVFPEPAYEQVVRELSLAILALTFGCLFLAGALGLWAIRSSVEIESRHRINRFVDAMDYLNDGLAVLDGNGRVTGSNPAARNLAPQAIPPGAAASIQQAFPCLTDEDLRGLLDLSQPREIERDIACAHGLRTLRFRSQPSEDIRLVLISDVTEIRSQEILRQQVALQQLVGRIAAGVAHDFNNILCAISGHAEILNRQTQDPAVRRQSVQIILEETARGSLLSRQLLELSRAGATGAGGACLPRVVEDAATLLRVALSPAWTVTTMMEGEYPAPPLTAAQVEQVVLNLGLLTADAQAKPGSIMISLHKPGQGHLLDVGNRFAAVILVSGEGSLPEAVELRPAGAVQASAPEDEGGVVLSVVNSIVEQAHGRMDRLTGPTGACVFRVCLPCLDLADADGEKDSQADRELNRYVLSWKFLLGGTGPELERWKRHLASIGAGLLEKRTLTALLADSDSCQALDVMIVDQGILGLEADGLLKALHKLYPRTGILVLGQNPIPESAGPGSRVAFAPYGFNRGQMAQALIEAKGKIRMAAAAASG